MKKSIYFVLLAIFSILLYSCSDDLSKPSVGETDTSVLNMTKQSDIPFADNATLSGLLGDKDVNNYSLVRKMALIEMEMELRQSMNWNGAKLSEKPVIVYDYDSKPKYYEFIVLAADGSPIGTITTFAKKQSDAAVSFALPYVRDYTPVITKGASYKTFIGNYPNAPYYGVLGKSGDFPPLITSGNGEAITEMPLVDEAQEAINQINNLSSEELVELGITDKSSAIHDIVTINNETIANAQEFWNTVEELEEELLALTDDQITEKVNESKGFYDSYSEHIISQFNQANLVRTRWNGWCGPSALAWLYRGVYSSYNGSYIPLHSESGFQKSGYQGEWGREAGYGTSQYFFMPKDKPKSYNKDWFTNQSKLVDGGLYGDLSIYCHIHNNGFQGGTSFYPYLQSAAEKVIKGYYLDMQNLVFSNHVSHIRNNRPCIVAVNWLGHYVAAFGVKERHLSWEIVIKIFGWRKRISTKICKTGEWLYVVDNGNETSGNGYLPFWRYDYLRFNPKFVLRKR